MDIIRHTATYTDLKLTKTELEIVDVQRLNTDKRGGPFHERMQISMEQAIELQGLLNKVLGVEPHKVLPSEVELARVKKVDGVIAYRNRTGRGLKESKDAVEAAMGESVGG
jgi:ribosomal protein L7/L12